MDFSIIIMRLRRSILRLLFCIQRRFLSMIRNSRYWPWIILAMVMYMCVFIYIHDETTSLRSDSFFDKYEPQQQSPTGRRFYRKHLHDHVRRRSLYLSSHRTNATNETNETLSHEARGRYSFVDLDHLNVDVDYLDEEYEPSENIYIEFPNPQSHPLTRLLNVKGDASTIVYNRIPQTYEFTMGSLLENVSYMHSYSYVRSDIYSTFSYNRTALTSIAKSLHNHKQHRLIYERHIYFFDFYNLSFPSHPVWINLVRDPWYRVVADFNASREICRLTNRCFVRRDTINDTLDTCVAKYPPKHCISPMNGVSKMIPFFWGLTDARQCRRNSTFALEQAKQNIDFYYTVVGVAEDFYLFLYVLEKLLPQYFRLARLVYMNQRDANHLVDERDINVKLPSQQTYERLRPLLEDEYQLYDYIKQRFRDQYQILTELDH